MDNVSEVQSTEERQKCQITNLNIDCLDYIFKIISNVNTEINVARVCTIFYDVIAYMWRRNPFYHTLHLELWRDVVHNEADLGFLVNAISDYIKCIKTSYCLNELLSDIKRFNIESFRSVQRCEMLEFYHYSPTDEEIQTLVKLLPNLTYLHLSAAINGRHIANFTKLEELYLFGNYHKSFEIESKHMREICEQLHNLRVLDIRNYKWSNVNLEHITSCKKLTTLKLNLNALKPILKDVLNMVALKRLRVLLDDASIDGLVTNTAIRILNTNESVEFYEIIERMSSRITSIAVDNCYLSLGDSWYRNLKIWRYKKLEKFAFCNCIFKINEMLQPFTEMSKLKLLSVRNCIHVSNETLLNFILLCPGLEHLDVCCCNNLSGEFLHAALDILKQRIPRAVPLTIYYICSGLSVEIERNEDFWQNQKLLNFVMGFPPNSDFSMSYVDHGYEFEFSNSTEEPDEEIKTHLTVPVE